ncbi:hypothetical protein GCM10010525_33470 [Glutamicibacter bergerei]
MLVSVDAQAMSDASGQLQWIAREVALTVGMYEIFDMSLD